MAHSRLIGLRYSFMLLILLGNLALFAGWVALEPFLSFVTLTDVARPWVYAFAICAAVFYATPQLYRYIDKITLTRLFDAIGVTSHIMMAMAVGFAFIYVGMKDSATSRFFLLLFLLMAGPFNVFLIRVLPALISKTFFPDKRKDHAILVGDGPMPLALVDYLQKCDILGIRFIGYYADEPIENLSLPHLGPREAVYQHTGTQRIDRVLLFHDTFCDTAFRNIVDYCTSSGMRLQIYTSFANAFPDQVRVVTDGELSFFTFQEERLENPLNHYLKRLLDIAVSLPIVVFVLPLLSLWVWWKQRCESPGPVLFVQTRYGRNRESFRIYKYRSMHTRDTLDNDEIQQATEDDPRIFSFGRFMRKTSLDEFPQFVNVLRGEMSIVGPRPHLVEHDDQFERVYHAYRTRHFVKPGITGYAQIHGFRGEVKEPSAVIQRVEFDLNYIANWSIALDIYIIARTAFQVIFPPRTAY